MKSKLSLEIELNIFECKLMSLINWMKVDLKSIFELNNFNPIE